MKAKGMRRRVTRPMTRSRSVSGVMNPGNIPPVSAERLVDFAEERGADVVGRPQTVDGDETGAAAIVSHDRTGERVVGGQAVPDRLRVVVFAADERAAAVRTALAVLLHLVGYRLRQAAGVADTAAAETPHDRFVVDFEEDRDERRTLHQLLEHLRLHHGARKAVEQE